MSPGIINKTIRRHYIFVLITAVLLAVGSLIAVKWYRYQLNPDAVNYISIARQYAAGNLDNAINGYWGPLLSWLLVPAVKLGVAMIPAAKILAVLTALAMSTTLYIFLIGRGASRVLANMLAAASSLLLVTIALVGPITPDLLIAWFSILFAMLLPGFITKPSYKTAVWLGTIGALMYFSKGFGFFLFLGVGGLVGLWQLIKDRPLLARNLKFYLIAAAVFAVICAPFIGAISAKYHKLTINNAGSFDHALFGPAAKGHNYPWLVVAPLQPATDSALWLGEDPSYMTELLPDHDWSPLESGASLKYFLVSTIVTNIDKTIDSIAGFGALASTGLLVLVIGILRPWRYRRESALFLLVCSLMALGYCLVFTEARYLIGLQFLAMAGLGLWLTTLQKEGVISRSQIIIGGLIVLAVIGSQSAGAVNRFKYADRLQYDLVKDIGSVVPKGSKIVSDQYTSYYACYHLQLRCLGVADPFGRDGQAYYESLKQAGVEYYIDYQSPAPAIRNFADNYFTLLQTGVPGLAVRRIN